MSVAALHPGNHLRVRRGIYSHHGIYVGDGKVVDFSGGTLTAKFQTSVREVSVETFSKGATVEVVPHPGKFLGGFGVGLPPPLVPEEIVHRARWVIENRPPARYHVVGSNCEHVANWCVTGWYFESLQVRRIFLISNVALHSVLWAGLARGQAVRRHVLAVILVALAAGVGPLLYNHVPYRRWGLLRAYPGYPGNEDDSDEEDGEPT